MCGMCAIASAELMRRLGEDGSVTAVMVEDATGTWRHVYVEVAGVEDEDGVMTRPVIVDVTACQFDAQPVEVVPRHALTITPYYWDPHGLRFTTTASLVRGLRELGWPQCQVPSAPP